MNAKRISLFTLVYFIIAIATAHHTSWSAATVMNGAMPSDANTIALIGWWLSGLAFAIAVDVSMFAVAARIREGERNVGFVVAFAFVALMSTYTQLLYAWAHVQPLHALGNGVSAEWIANLQWLIDLRIVLLPLALPVISVLYTIAGIGGHAQAHEGNAPSVSVAPQPIIPIQQNFSFPVIADATQAPRISAPSVPQIALRSGASGGQRTGATDNAVTQSEDGMHLASCPVCNWQSAKESERSARNALVAHMRRHEVRVNAEANT